MNRIKQITGLSGLRKLTDLSLYCNQISLLEGLDDQKDSLEVLSIGRNHISDHANIAYLRPFSRLQIVCLEHNPVATESSEYRGSTIAVLPHLRYLDWVVVGPGERRQASESFHRLVTDADDSGSGTLTTVGGRATTSTLGGSVPASGIGGHTVDRDAEEAGLFFAVSLWRLMTEASGGTELAGGALGHVGDDATETKQDGGGAKAGGGGGRGSVSMNASPAVDGRTLLRVLGVKERMEAYREAVSLQIEQVSADVLSRVLYKLYCCSDVLQIVGRGLATHAEILRETVAADYVRESYEEASNNEAKGLVAAYARLRKQLMRQIEGKVEAPVASAAADQQATRSKHHHPRLGTDADAARDGLAAADADMPGISGPAAAADTMQTAKASGDAASVSSESEAAAIESAIRCLNRLAAENDTLRGKLLSIETTLHEQVITVITEFDAAYAEVGAKRTEAFNKFFRAVEKEELAVNEDLKVSYCCAGCVVVLFTVTPLVASCRRSS